jgi:hypothetical protein
MLAAPWQGSQRNAKKILSLYNDPNRIGWQELFLSPLFPDPLFVPILP